MQKINWITLFQQTNFDIMNTNSMLGSSDGTSCGFGDMGWIAWGENMTGICDFVEEFYKTVDCLVYWFVIVY